MHKVTDEEVVGIRGAFWQPDIAIFRVLLAATGAIGGDLAEVGVLFGRSAVLVGSYLDPGETFTVVDLFESPAIDFANAQENRTSYPGLTRSSFEANYLTHNPRLPVVVEGPSSSILSHAAIAAHRFVHVDGSHLFEHVSDDISNAQQLLKPDGVLVVDDFRAEHTPGVAAAAWQAVVTTGLRPFAVSPNKMYATWGDDDRWRSVIEEWAATSLLAHETQNVNGRPIVRVSAAPHRSHWSKAYVPPVAWPALARWGQRRLRRTASSLD